MILSRRRKRGIKMTDRITSKRDLMRIKHIMMPTFASLGITRNIRQFPIRFGQKKEFIVPNSTAFYNKKEIVVRRGRTFIELFGDLTHEYGHEVSIMGGIGLRSNIVTEITAINFQKTYICNFNQIHGTTFTTHRTPFWEAIWIATTHRIASYFAFIPFGRLIKPKYRRTDTFISIKFHKTDMEG